MTIEKFTGQEFLKAKVIEKGEGQKWEDFNRLDNRLDEMPKQPVQLVKQEASREKAEKAVVEKVVEEVKKEAKPFVPTSFTGTYINTIDKNKRSFGMNPNYQVTYDQVNQRFYTFMWNK